MNCCLPTSNTWNDTWIFLAKFTTSDFQSEVFKGIWNGRVIYFSGGLPESQSVVVVFSRFSYPKANTNVFCNMYNVRIIYLSEKKYAQMCISRLKLFMSVSICTCSSRTKIKLFVVKCHVRNQNRKT